MKEKELRNQNYGNGLSRVMRKYKEIKESKLRAWTSMTYNGKNRNWVIKNIVTGNDFRRISAKNKIIILTTNCSIIDNNESQTEQNHE